ncbi:MAG: TatD family hydrolase [Methanoregulaceae archaeon]|nr:TatD family hydrolase [Methanoregulaceae archaeon]
MSMTMQWIDTHCHLNDPKAFPSVDDDLRELADLGIGTIIIGVDPESSRLAVELADQHELVWAVVGRHPNYAADFVSAELQSYSEWLSHPKVVALGEIGLDWHWDYATPEQQYAALREQLALATDLDVPIVIHCREAYDDLIEEFSLHERVPRCVFHCFAGSATHARQVLGWDSWFGVDGPVTYPKSLELRELINTVIPRDRLVLETDSPYLSPVPYRGKPNHPRFLPLIGDEVARAWQVDAYEVAQITTKNAIECFGLKLK